MVHGPRPMGHGKIFSRGDKGTKVKGRGSREKVSTTVTAVEVGIFSSRRPEDSVIRVRAIWILETVQRSRMRMECSVRGGGTGAW